MISGKARPKGSRRRLDGTGNVAAFREMLWDGYRDHRRELPRDLAELVKPMEIGSNTARSIAAVAFEVPVVFPFYTSLKFEE